MAHQVGAESEFIVYASARPLDPKGAGLVNRSGWWMTRKRLPNLVTSPAPAVRSSVRLQRALSSRRQGEAHAAGPPGLRWTQRYFRDGKQLKASLERARKQGIDLRAELRGQTLYVYERGQYRAWCWCRVLRLVFAGEDISPHHRSGLPGSLAAADRATGEALPLSPGRTSRRFAAPTAASLGDGSQWERSLR